MKRFYLFAVLAASLALPSCKIMYMPNAQNVPLMKEKGEIRANVGVSNYQGSYALTENIGLMLNGQYRNSTFTGESGSYNYEYSSSRWLVEGGGGYFKPLGEDGVVEAYGGLGYGGVTFDRSSQDSSGGTQVNSTDRYNANMIKLFIQPAIGVTSEYADFAFSMRFVGAKFSSIDTIGYTEQDLINEQISGVEKPFFAFIEPAITVRGGWKYVKFHTQFIYSHLLTKEELNRSPFNFNVGINICIADRHKD